jgi:hypothetical protein
MLVTSKACNPTSTRLSSNKINQPEVTGKTLTEPNDPDQSKIYEKALLPLDFFPPYGYSS